MLQVQELCEYIGIPVPETWEKHFAEAMERYDSQWLEDLDFTAILKYYGFADNFYYETIEKGLRMVREDEKLHRVCWLIHYLLFYAPSSARVGVHAWGSGAEAYKEHGSDVINVIALYASQPLHVKNMELRGYDEEQIKVHKLGMHNTWLGEHEDYGTDGISFRLLGWGTMYTHCRLVRLGRLIYQYAPTKYPSLNEMGEEYCVIDLHIPTASNGLQDADVEASVQLAKEKLSRYFPEAAGKTILCAVSTWLLSPQLKDMLKPDSNIIKFQNRFTLTKVYPGTQSFLINAFHITKPVSEIDVSTLPEDSSLRRAIKERLLRGEEFQNGVGYFICR